MTKSWVELEADLPRRLADFSLILNHYLCGKSDLDSSIQLSLLKTVIGYESETESVCSVILVP